MAFEIQWVLIDSDTKNVEEKQKLDQSKFWSEL